MILIIKRISETTRVSDIERFLEPALRGGFLKKKGEIKNLAIQRYQTPDSSHVEYHAIVKVLPDAAGIKAIKLLNRKHCKGKPVNVTEYSIRHRLNDRRSNLPQRADYWRRVDRRRSDLHVTDVTKTRSGHEGRSDLFGASLNLTPNPFDNGFRI